MSLFKKIMPNVFEIENLYNPDDLEKILEKFKNNQKWQHILQNKPDHYSHVFKNDSYSLPDTDEPYLASFWKNIELADDDFIKNTTIKLIKENFYKHLKIDNLDVDLRCHKFEKNDFFRVHMDGYAGGYAVTISLNKNWKWDWGGILNIIYGKDNSEIKGLLPKWNSANILNNYKQSSPHFVTPIRDFALETRYTITCFIKT